MLNDQKKSNEEFGSGGRSSRFILIICSLLYMVNYMDRQVLSVVLEPMKVDLGLTDIQAGLLQTVFFLSMAVLAFPISFFVDRWSRRKIVAMMAIIWSAATYATGLGKSFIGVLLPRVLVGSGEAGFSAGGTAWITAAYPSESRGKVLGIFNVAIPVGAAIGVVLGGYLSTNYGGWRTPFFVFAVPGVALGIIAFFLRDYKTIKQPHQAATSVRNVLADTLELWRTPTLKWLYLGLGMRNIMAFSFLSWMPALFMRSLKISEAKAGMITGVMGLCAIIGVLLGGWLADMAKKRGGGGRVLVPALGDAIGAPLSFLGVLMLWQSGSATALDNPFVAASLIILTVNGIASVVGTAAFGAITQDVVHPRLKGVAWGMAVFCVYMLGGAWGPVLVGAISDNFGGGAAGIQIALMITTLGGILGAVCFWLSSRHYATDCEKVANFKIEAEK